MNSFQIQTNDLDSIRKECRQTKERSEIDKHNTTTISPRNDHHQPQQTKTLKIISTATSSPSKRLKVDHNQTRNQKTQNWVVMKRLPHIVCAQDIKAFFKGLTILNVYVYYYNCEQQTSKYADIYVEFSSNSGADLGNMRNGEIIMINKASGNDEASKLATQISGINNKQASWIKGACLRLVGNKRNTSGVVDYLRTISPSEVLETLIKTDPSVQYNTWQGFVDKDVVDNIYGCFDMKEKNDRRNKLTAVDSLFELGIDNDNNKIITINKDDDIIVITNYVKNILNELIKLKTLLIRSFISIEDIKKYNKNNDTHSANYLLLDLCSRMLVFFEIVNVEILKL